ncbi:MAG: ATP-binding protein [Bacilli bacterium]
MMIKRDYYLNKLIYYKDKDLIKVITGIRRVGKSFLLFNLYYDYLIKSGINQSNIIKINLESDKMKTLRDPVELSKYVNSKINSNDKYYLLIDEIQHVNDFEDVINGLRVDLNVDIYLTGSNSKLLSSDINTKLRGRSIEIKLYPLSFFEYHNYYQGDLDDDFKEYLLYGGLPYLINEDDSNGKIAYLKMINETVVIKDIVERHKIRNPHFFNAVYEFLCSNIGSYVSAYKIANTLKSNGYKTITSDTVSNYLEFLTNAYLFYKVNRYDVKGKAYLKTQNKYYASDIGMRNAKINYRQLEITHTLENIIYLELLRRGYIVDIGKNYNSEIDFIAKNKQDTYYLQVSYTINDPNIKERELKAFKNLADGYKKIVLTMDKDPYLHLENGYKKVNIIDFLLKEDILELI